MRHLGDITKIRGCAAPVVDVVIGGSPCQDLSITGACRQGSEAFVKSLGDKLKDRYTIRECIDLTRGQYNAERFAEFFGED